MWLFFAVLPLFAQHEQQAKDKPRHPFINDPVAVEAGRQLFASGCAGCHGPDGGGGRGPNLRERVVWHPTEDDGLFKTVRNGVGVMPGSKAPDDDIWRIVAYVRSLTSPAFEVKTKGDPAAGSEVFWGSAGCSGCHRIGNRGGFGGPNLSNVGLSSTVPKLHDAIVEPDAEIAEGYQKVSVTLRTGEKLEGVARNRSNYSLQLQSSDGKLQMIDMGKVEQVTLHKTTAMPLDYAKRLSRADIDNLVAFLSRQAAGAPAVAAAKP